MRLHLGLLLIVCTLIGSALPLNAQQKGQYMPGQFGLNAGILPSPGFTYVNMEINYDTSTLNDPSGHKLPGNANLNLWVIENIYYYVPNTKFLGGNLGFSIIVPTVANGSLTLENLGITGSTWGLADTWVQPFTLGWHPKRADIQIGDAFMTPSRTLFSRREKQYRFRLFWKSLHNRNNGLPNQEQSYQRQPVYRLGGTRAEAGRQQHL
jgi:hypothetical protein